MDKVDGGQDGRLTRGTVDKVDGGMQLNSFCKMTPRSVRTPAQSACHVLDGGQCGRWTRWTVDKMVGGQGGR